MNEMMRKLYFQGGHLDGPHTRRCGCRWQSGCGCGRFHMIVDTDDLRTEICRRIAKRLAETNNQQIEKELKNRLVLAVVPSAGN